MKSHAGRDSTLSPEPRRTRFVRFGTWQAPRLRASMKTPNDVLAIDPG